MLVLSATNVIAPNFGVFGLDPGLRTSARQQHQTCWCPLPGGGADSLTCHGKVTGDFTSLRCHPILIQRLMMEMFGCLPHCTMLKVWRPHICGGRNQHHNCGGICSVKKLRLPKVKYKPNSNGKSCGSQGVSVVCCGREANTPGSLHIFITTSA
jgi:hypothetical protein